MYFNMKNIEKISDPVVQYKFYCLSLTDPAFQFHLLGRPGPNFNIFTSHPKLNFDFYLCWEQSLDWNYWSVLTSSNNTWSFSFHYRIISKNLFILLVLLLNAVSNFHPVCSFHNSDLLIPFVINFECLDLEWR